MKIREFFEKINHQITVYEPQEAKEITFWLLEHYLNLGKIDILMNNPLPSKTEQIDWQDIIKRLNSHEPIQYIIGETTFYGRKFLVNPSVLIPRPETEELVELAKFNLSHPASYSLPLNILDMGTGSGCIAISLAKELPDAQVFAWDISEAALEIAKKNAILNEAKVIFEKKDMLISSHLTSHISPLNLIVSNPPYVTQKEAKEMRKNVLDFEPHLALFVDDNNPLIFYEVIANFAAKNLIISGLVLVEINEFLGKETVAVFVKNGFSIVEIIKDIHQKERFIKAVKT